MINDLLNRVTCADSLSLLSSMNTGDITNFITSPPYNLKESTGGGTKWKNNTTWNGVNNWYDEHDDEMPHEDYVAWQRQYLTAMLDIIPDNGSIYYNHKWRVQNGLLQDRADILDGFPVRQIIIWHRSGGMNHTGTFYLPTYEVIYLICKPKFKLKDRMSGTIGDVWYIPQTKSKKGHPCSFPMEIPNRIITSVATPGIICDPFSGEGTVAAACKHHSIDYVAIDKSAKYCEMAEELISETEVLGDISIF